MPLKPPESYELDRPDSPARSRAPYEDACRYSQDSSDSDVGQLDPLKGGQRHYTDDAAQPWRSLFDSEKHASFSRRPLAWLGRQRKLPSRFCCFLALLFVAALVLLLSAGGIWVYTAAVPEDGLSEPWYPSPRGGTAEAWRESYDKARALVERMTLVEKVNITTGTGWQMGMCVGNTAPVSPLAFPSLCLQDGPLGLRFADNATAFPAAITVGASWNKTLMRERGAAHGLEARLKGINVLLGPSMGPLGRLPAGGRNWEGFGADPVLQGLAAAETIRGIQSAGVIATAKHWVGNEQEHFRQSWEWGTPNAISSNIDDRTLHEIYAWPFAEAVRAGVGSVMCSYNMVNDSYACQNSKLLNGVLKDELGFQGFVQSDWLAQRSGVASALAGLDMSMPGDGLRWQDGKSLWGVELTKAVLNSSVPVERLDDMVLRVVAAWYQLGQDDEGRWPKDGGPNFSSWTDEREGLLHPGSPGSTESGAVNKFVPVRQTEEGGDHDDLARRIAREGIVLVKNENNTLPLARNGSGLSPKAGFGMLRVGVFGEDAFANPRGDNACPDRGCNEGTLTQGWGSGAVELPYLVTPFAALTENFLSQMVELTAVRRNDDAHVDTVAAEQDLCLVFVNSDAGEGFLSWNGVRGDRNDLYAQKDGDALVQTIAGSCNNTVVILHTVGPTILENWIEHPSVKAVLIAHLPGQESGNALADVLFGDYNPSGHLPYTIAKREEDYGPDSKVLYYPNAVVSQQDFSEGLYVDYRYFDKHSVTPRYEFGYGLSYTTWKLSGLFVRPMGVHGELAARPEGIAAPGLSREIPDASEAVLPAGVRRLKKYIYPYLDSMDDVKKGQYKYPKGYKNQHPLSPAGGGEGGNPDLYTPALELQASLTNTGSRAGDAVVQVYISYPPNITDVEGSAVDMPVRVLRGFEKYYLLPGKQGRVMVKMSLNRKDLSYWDVQRQTWVLPVGEFEVCLGFSSRDLPACDTFEQVARISSGGGGGGGGAEAERGA